jgi:hypothetical protein
MIARTDVEWAYRLLLNREASDVEAAFWAEKMTSQSDLVSSFLNSEEFRSTHPRIQQTPFWHYHAAFDAEETIRKYSKKNIKPSPHHLTNYLGVKIRPEFFPDILSDKMGSVESIPIPANWHADIAEWASCLRAVDFATSSFAMAELGCGYGCWINNLGRAAKDSGKRIKLYGIEADLRRLEMAR